MNYYGINSKELEKYVTASLPMRDVIDFKRIFNQIDKNKNGKLEVKELKETFIRIGLDGRQAQMAEIMGILDNNNSNQLDFDEFLMLMTSNMITGANLGKFKNYFRL